MQMITHLCGQPLERCAGDQGSYLTAKPSGHARVHHVEVQSCPRCGETLCDSDMTDRADVPLMINNPSAWSIARRAALAGLIAAGYALSYDNGYWRIATADRDYDTASTDNLDAMIALATALTAGQTPIRLVWNWLNGSTEHVWTGLYSPATGRALGGAAMGAPEQIRVRIDGQRVEVQRDDESEPQIGHVWRRTAQEIVVEFFAGS